MNAEWLIVILVFLIFKFLDFEKKKKPTYEPTVPPKKDPDLDTQTKKQKSKDDIKYEKELTEWKNKKTDELLNSQSLFKLTQIKTPLNLGYSDLLNTLEWQIKRLEILSRDSYICRNCSKKSEKLHVHHKWYIKDEFPWEIENDGLVALCHYCHKDVHKKEEIPVYGKNSDGTLYHTINYNIYCTRCSGAGWFPQYKHVEDGICFKCRGDSISSTIFSNAIVNFNKHKSSSYEDELLVKMELLLLKYDINFYRDKIKPMYPDIRDDLPF